MTENDRWRVPAGGRLIPPSGRAWALVMAFAIGVGLVAGAATPRGSANLSLQPLGTSPTTIASNREAIAGMDSRTLAELRASKSRFDRLPAAEQRRLREFHTALMEHPRSPVLRQVLLQFADWLKSLDEVSRARLEDMAGDDLLAEVCRLRFESRPSPAIVSPVDLETFDQWLRQQAENRARQIDEALAQLPVAARLRARGGLPAEPAARLRMVLLALPPEQAGAILGPDSVAGLRASLSGSSQWLASPDVIRQMVRAAVMPSVMSRQELQRFFDRLSPQEQVELDRLPSEERTERLRRLFLRSRLGAGGPAAGS